MQGVSPLIQAMMEYYHGDAKRINHFIKVYGFAKTLGELDGLTEQEQRVLEITAVTHDIGIKVSEEKYQSSSGHYQEIEGPPLAEQLLGDLGFEQQLIEQVVFIIGHHHTYTAINSRVFQLLVEADFLVNVIEDDISQEGIHACEEKIFKSHWGKVFLNHLISLT